LSAKYTSLIAIPALVAGLAIGFAGSTLGYRYGLLRLPGERPLQRMARVLHLTPTQREQIRAVMHETRSKMESARERFEQERHAMFLDAYLRIRAVLTPAQQQTFDARFVPPTIRAEARKPQPRISVTPAMPTGSPSPPAP
jgi:Spy/CpxP family protein refolding chaperone